MSGARQALAVLLAVVAGLAAVAGAAAWQLRDAVVEPRGLGDRALAALDEPPVRQVVAAEIAAQATAGGLIDETRARAAVDAAMATRAFREGFRASAEQVHAALVDRDRGRATLRVDLTAPLAEAQPQLAALLGDVGAADIAEVSAADLPAEPARAADLVDTAAVVLLPLACFALAAALLVATGRAAALIAAGVALAVGGALLLGTLELGRSTAVDTARPGAAAGLEATRAAIGAAWDAFTGGLHTTALVAMGAGALLALGGVVGRAAARA